MSNLKQLRGQLRQIAQEILPELIKEELFKHVLSAVNVHMAKLEGVVKKNLEDMNERQKNFQAYLIRQTSQQPTKDESNE